MLVSIIAIGILGMLVLFVVFAVIVRKQISELKELLQMKGEKYWREDNAPVQTPVHRKPNVFPPVEVAKTAIEEAEKVKELAMKKKNEFAQQQLDFTVEPETHKPSDPNKPKRKSPIPHNRVNNKDEFWHEVIREYFALKKKNPALTRADFVRTKNDPRIKAKTFNSKLHYMSKYGALPHKKNN